MGRTGSAEHRLLVLGLLRMQEMHGYQLAEVIESHYSGSSRIKKPTLYDTLRRLSEEGSVAGHDEQEGNRPTRTVYSLTPQGEEEFLSLLRDTIGTYTEPDLHDEPALMFLGTLPAGEARALLESRRRSLETLLREEPGDDGHHGALDAITSRRAHHLRAEAAWLDETLAGLPA